MTLACFRYFPTKDAIVLTAGYDPLLIESLRAQPPGIDVLAERPVAPAVDDIRHRHPGASVVADGGPHGGRWSP